MPDLDSRFERLYGYLNDDVTRRRASIGLALELAGAPTTSGRARRALSPSGPLVDLGLVLVEDPDRPFLTRSLRVPDRVIAHLLGDPSAEPSTQLVLVDVEGYPSTLANRLAHALGGGASVVHVREREGGTAAATAVAALGETGRDAVVVDLTLLAHGPDPQEQVLACAREALLRDAGLVAGPVEDLAEQHLESVQRLCWWPTPVLFFGTATWDPRWSTTPPLAVEAPVLGARERISLLHSHLERVGAEVDPDSLGAHLSLGPAQVQRAVHAAQIAARLDGGRVTADDLRAGIRAQNAAGLERLARRIVPEVGWDDLVVAPPVRRALEELTARARHRDQVLVDWRMRKGGGRGRGVTALFAGDSGTGKTMSAEVIATDLGLDLYTVNLATVVDKYVGETEKNLERIFAEAGGVNAVLFFDEADAIFGKRSEVRDAHDRYANIESAYLLQRLETFDGLAVLATNLRANIDEAFTRRLDAIIDFPAPTPDLRRALWRQCLGSPLPVADDVDVEFLRRLVRAGGRQRPLRRDHRGVPGGRGPGAGIDVARRPGGRAGVPQAGAAGAGEGVRPLPGAAHGVIARTGREVSWDTGSGSTWVRRSPQPPWTHGTGPTMLGLGNRALRCPRWSSCRPDGTLLFGEAADRRAVTEPSRAAREFKRRIGDPVPLLIEGQPYSPQSLYRQAPVVGGVGGDRTAGIGPGRGGGDLSRELGRLQARAPRQLVSLADVPGVADVHRTGGGCDPVRVACRARRRRQGGGLRPRRRHLRRLRPREAGHRLPRSLGSPDGVEHLGGIDFDEAVFQHVLDKLADRLAAHDPDDPEVTAGWRDCVASASRPRRRCRAT